MFLGSEPSPLHRQGLPPWDRTLDAIYHTHSKDAKPIDKRINFSGALNSFFAVHRRERSRDGFFRLPDKARFLVCLHLLAPYSQPTSIRLNKRSFNKDVWHETDFQPLQSALEPLKAYLGVSFAFRADILLAFLSENTFHATFSPYVGSRISPFATTWLNTYGPFMQNIAIEVDMTRLGYGPGREAINLLSGANRIETLLQNFVESQLRRDESRPLESLILLCRRFYGPRTTAEEPPVIEPSGRASAHSRRSQKSEAGPSLDILSRPLSEDRIASPAPSIKRSSSVPTEALIGDNALLNEQSNADLDDWPLSPFSPIPPVDYCPDADLAICNHILRLRNRVDSIRMCGFSETYTNQFITTLFPSARDSPELHSYRVTPSTIWPRLSGQTSCVDMGDGSPFVDNHDTSKKTLAAARLLQWEGCVQLPPPIIDPKGTPSLPPMVELLQQSRSRASQCNISMPERPLTSLRQQLELASVPAQGSSDRKRIMRLLEKYGKPRVRQKRMLTREAATTL